jgi:hypothetical protein
MMNTHQRLIVMGIPATRRRSVEVRHSPWEKSKRERLFGFKRELALRRGIETPRQSIDLWCQFH